MSNSSSESENIIESEGADNALRALARSTSDSNLVGTVFNGRFRVDSFLGAGGYGEVYKCTDLSIERTIALKVLSSRLDDKTIRRFQTEATAISRLDHANLVRIFEFGLSSEDRPYIIMEFIEGKSLAEVLAQEVAMSEQNCIELFLPIFDALQAIHDKGVIHRDLKPGNIIISQRNGAKFPKIVDFGIAKILNESGNSQSQLTQTGEIFGSPLYMSPEQACGIKVDVRTDQYSLGCLIFECLTGTPPHVGKTSIETLIRHQNEETPTLKEASLGKRFSDELEKALARLLQKDPGARFESMSQAKEAFSGCLASGSGPSSETAIIRHSSLKKCAYPVLAVAALGALAFSICTAYAPKSHSPEIATPATESSKQISDKEKLVGEAASRQKSPSRLAADNLSNYDPVKLAVNNNAFIQFLSANAQARDIRVNPDLTNDRLLSQKAPTFNEDISDEAMRGFDQIYFVRKLTLLNCNLLTDSGMKHIMHLPLDDVDLTMTPVTDKTAQELLKLPSLRCLGLKSSKVTDRMLTEKSPSLISLILNNTQISDAGLVKLTNFPRLVSLSIAGTKITDAGVAQLRKLKLNGLWISDTAITDGASASISTMKDLEFLSVSSTSVSNEFLGKLDNLKRLRQLRVENCPHISDSGIAAFRKQHPHCVVFNKPIFKVF